MTLLPKIISIVAFLVLPSIALAAPLGRNPEGPAKWLNPPEPKETASIQKEVATRGRTVTNYYELVQAFKSDMQKTWTNTDQKLNNLVERVNTLEGNGEQDARLPISSAMSAFTSVSAVGITLVGFLVLFLAALAVYQITVRHCCEKVDRKLTTFSNKYYEKVDNEAKNIIRDA
ncbi:hypothetical protein DdX_13780 [Ditylenchus destructor]|uniref:Uncharacterized protein n=1 Tax=Ditylenchus destructor TaxID=166010 RepID=A0AAD4MVI2_9BILA|nr:hypothetical protein DdX_13780 [Ditylenchus destructor]